MMKRNKNTIVILVSLLLGLLLGWVFFSGGNEAQEEHSHAEASVEVWTCSMHPQIRQPEPGDCPICGMDLIPLESETAQEDPLVLRMSENAMRLANVQTIQLGAATSGRKIQLNGRVAVDERRVSVQTSHIPGRIENLLVNFTGESVRRGQGLARVYSPQLVTAQEELLQAYSIRESQPELFEAAKDKLRNWRIGEGQINRILERQEASEELLITADASGVVTEKMVELGDYVERGTPIYEIADLSQVWVLFDIYENMSWIREGQTVEFTVASFPGETFEGTIQFVDPLLNNQTRVSTARVVVDNPEGRLKPGMFVSGVVESNMEATVDELTVPRSAVLWTGERSVVYVKEGTGEFRMREVVLGNALGEAYVIKEGLSEGEEVVVNGAFTVDAAAQLAGKPSMMSPEILEDDVETSEEVDLRAFINNTGARFSEVPKGFQKELGDLSESYLAMKDALVASDKERSENEAQRFLEELNSMEANQLSAEAHSFWNKSKARMETSAQTIAASGDLEEQREAFVSLSSRMAKVMVAFGNDGKALYIGYCPMANSDEGAFWLTATEEIRNPYYGERMLTCGEIVTEIQ